VSPRRQLALVAALVALVAAYDFFGRVHVGRDAALRTVTPLQLAPLPARADADTIRKQLNEWLPALAGSAGLAAVGNDPTGWQLSLVGVFRQDGQRFALLNAQPRTGGAAELVSVKEGEEIHGSTVKQIGATQVILAAGDASQELVIFEIPESINKPRESVTQGGAGASAAPGASSPTAPAPTRKATAATAAPAAGPKVARPQELKPGEEIKLPWNLPVVEDDGARPEKKR